MSQEFYIPEETSENDLFSNQMKSGINFDKYAHIPVKVSDPSRNSAPKPIKSFEEGSLGGLLLENIKRCGYKTPTPIQKNGIPIILVSLFFLSNRCGISNDKLIFFIFIE